MSPASKPQPPPPERQPYYAGGPHQPQQEAADSSRKRAEPGPEHLDAGYAWPLLLAMFLLQSASGGSQRVHGLVFARQLELGGATGLGQDRQRASWPLAGASLVENLAGCLTPYLLLRHPQLSWRHLQLASLALLAAANLGAYLSRSLLLDCLCLGLVQGLGLSISAVLLLAVNNDYFRRFRTSAYCLAMSGSTCGALYLGPTIQWLLARSPEEPQSFRLAYLALGLLFVACAPLALLVVPRREAGAVLRWRRAARPSGGPGPGQARKVSRFERSFERRTSLASISLECRLRRISAEPPQPARRPPDPEAAARANTQEAGRPSLAGLLRNPFLHCAWLMLALYFTVSRLLMLALPDLARDRGLAGPQADRLLAHWSLGELAGRLLLGPLIDLRPAGLGPCVAATCAGLGAALGLLMWQPAAAGLVAALSSLEYALINALLAEYLGPHLATTCYSLASLLASPLLLLRPALLGLFRDRLGSYDGLLLLLAMWAGAFGLLFGLLEPQLRRRWPPPPPPPAQ